MSVKLRPLSNRVVVIADDPKELSEGGIYFPTQAQEKPQIGEVIEIGPGKVSDFPVVTRVEHFPKATPSSPSHDTQRTDFLRMPMSIAKGDKVLFGKYSGVDVQIDRDKFIVLRETEILAIILPHED